MKSIDTLQLFEDLNQELIYFLADLTPDDWQQPTLLEGRSVKDVTSQIVFGSLRRISFQRDHFIADAGVSSQSVSVQPINIKRSSEEWMMALRQISPRLLVEMLKKYEQELFELLARLRSDEISTFNNDASTQTQLPNWLDVAQVYAHKWLRQSLLRKAAGVNLLMSERFLHPWYETVLLSLPDHLTKVAASYPDQTLEIEISGEIRLRNRLQKSGSKWRFVESGNEAATTGIKIPASVGWLLFSGFDSEFQNHKTIIENHGDEALVQHVLHLRPAYL